MTPKTEIFGNINNVKVGDLVTWSRLSINFIGIVKQVYLENFGGRKIAFSSVFCFKNEKSYEVLCLNLSLMKKGEFHHKETN